jgi:hypothetical protein
VSGEYSLVFLIALALTVPLKALTWFRVNRQSWLIAAITLTVIVIAISGHLRRS